MNNMKWNVKIIRCENAGGNKTLKNCTKRFEEIKFEFTSPGTPQKNGVVEGGFATLYYQMHAMMAHVGIQENLKNGLWPEWGATATKLENIMVNPDEEKCAHEKLYGEIPDYTKYLRNFG